MRASGVLKDKVEKTLKTVFQLYRRTTGLDVLTFNNKYMGQGADLLKLTQQLAHLPFATISSLTEPLIVLSRVDLADTPWFVNAYIKAGSMQVKKIFGNFMDRMSVLWKRN